MRAAPTRMQQEQKAPFLDLRDGRRRAREFGFLAQSDRKFTSRLQGNHGEQAMIGYGLFAIVAAVVVIACEAYIRRKVKP